MTDADDAGQRGPRDTVTVREVCQRLGLSRATVYRLLDSGRLPGIDVGTRDRHRWIIPRTRYERWLAGDDTEDNGMR